MVVNKNIHKKAYYRHSWRVPVVGYMICYNYLKISYLPPPHFMGIC